MGHLLKNQNISEKITQFFSVEEITCKLKILFPYWKCMATRSQRTRLRVFLKTGYRCKSSFHDFQYLTYSIFFRLAAEAVTAAFTAYSGKQSTFDQILDNDFQIFFGDLLPFGDILERDITALAVLRKIDHYAQSVPSLC